MCFLFLSLLTEPSLSVDDFYHLTGIQQKDIRKLLAKLRDDRLVSVQSRQEVKVGNQRPIHRDYYFINFHSTVDAIKYRIFSLTNKVKDLYTPSEEKKDYYCPRCKAKWTQLEVLDKVFEGGFLCHRCDGVLERDEVSAADRAGHEKQSRLMSQIDPLLELLKRIDSEEVPPNDFASALAMAVPVVRDKETHPVTETSELKSDTKQTSKLKQEVNMEVKVNFITEESTNAADAAAKARKAEQEKQNALPAWYTHSAVEGAKAESNSSPTGATAPPQPTGLKAEAAEDKKDKDLTYQSEIDAYYASLAADQIAAATQESESASSEGEDDGDGFEDVDIGGGGVSGVGTPSSSMSGALGGTPRSTISTNGINGNGKRAAENVTSHAADPDTSPTKKVRTEDGKPDASADSTPAGTQATYAGDSDEDDEEFEDAL